MPVGHPNLVAVAVSTRCSRPAKSGSRRAGLASASGQRDWPVAAWRRSTRPCRRLGAAAAAGRDGQAGGAKGGRRLDLPLDVVVGHVLDLHRRGVTVVLTLDPPGCTVVTLIG